MTVLSFFFCLSSPLCPDICATDCTDRKIISSICAFQAFGQFDAEGDGIVDVENMLMALKNSNGANLQGELSHVIRQLQACSLTPGVETDMNMHIYLNALVTGAQMSLVDHSG